MRLSLEAQRLAHRHCTGLVFRKAFDAESFFELAHTATKLQFDTPEAQSAGSRSYVGPRAFQKSCRQLLLAKCRIPSLTRHTISQFYIWAPTGGAYPARVLIS